MGNIHVYKLFVGLFKLIVNAVLVRAQMVEMEDVAKD